jgi:hypothetical protein
VTTQPEALRLADLLGGDPNSKAQHIEAAAELRRLHSVNAELLEALRQSADLAEYWFLREDRRNLSESEHKTWHALGYGSSAYKAARAAIDKAEEVKP